MSIPVDVHGNTDPLVRDITAAVDRINKSGRLKIQLDSRGVTQPLGRMTRSADEFTKSLEASNARVLAFGASVGVINAVSQAFKGVVQATMDVQKNLTDINVVMGLTNRELDRFGGGLMKVAKETGAGFKAASDAATEFARQGLSVSETLKRTSDALILTRLTGMDAAESVKSITAAMNTFGSEVKNSTELVSKFAAVDVKFAVSAGDFAQAISRAGQSARQAGVDIDTFVGMVTAAQERTARGGAVIGNALKTIFTRVQKPETLRQLEALGIAVRDMRGNTIEADKIIQSLAKSWDSLTDSQRASTGQTVAGMFQINILKAVMADMAKQNSVTSEAMKISSRATDESTKKNELLRQTMSALAGETGVAVQELAKKIGDLALAPGISKILDSIKGLAEGLGGALGDGEGEGNKFAKGLLKGIGNILTGPGLVVFAAVAGKLFFNAFKYAKDSLGSLLNVNKAATKRVALEQSLMQVITKEDAILKEMLRTDITRSEKQKVIVDLIKQQTREAERLARLTRSMSGPMLKMGITPDLSMKKRAAGYIPNYADSATQERREAAKGGYVAGEIRQGPGFVYNDKERWKKFPGLKEPGLLPPKPSKASKEYTKDFYNKHGFDPYAAGGYIPNFAPSFTGRGNAMSVFINKSGKRSAADVAAAEEYLVKGGHLGEYVKKSSAITTPSQAGMLPTWTAGGNPLEMGAKKSPNRAIDARNFATMLLPTITPDTVVKIPVDGPAETISDLVKGGKLLKGKKGYQSLDSPGKKIYGQQLKRSVMFNVLGLDPDSVKSGRQKGIGWSVKTIMNRLANEGYSSLGSKMGNSLEMGKLDKITSETIKHEMSKPESGGFGALNAMAGSIFEAALNSRLGIGGGAAKYAGEKGRTPLGGDFDVRSGANRGLLNTLFGGKVAPLADYKNAPSEDNRQSFAKKILQEMVYRKDPRVANAFSTTDDKGKTIKLKLGTSGGSGKLMPAAGGFVPNYANPLGDAIGRESSALSGRGIPANQIRIGAHRKLVSSSNPAGLGVTNTTDEPNGLGDVLGAGQGLVPNYAMPSLKKAWDSDLGGGGKAGLKNQLNYFMGAETAMDELQEAIDNATKEFEELGEEVGSLKGSIEADQSQIESARQDEAESAKELADAEKSEANLSRFRQKKSETKQQFKDRYDKEAAARKARTAAAETRHNGNVTKLNNITYKNGLQRTRVTQAEKELEAVERRLAETTQRRNRGGGLGGRARRFAGSQAGSMMMYMGLPMLAGQLQSGALGGTGTALNAAGTGVDTAYAAGGMLSGAASGGMMGAMMMPLLTPILGPFAALAPVVGAGVGAFQSFTSATEEATKAIKEKRMKEREEEWQKAYATGQALGKSVELDYFKNTSSKDMLSAAMPGGKAGGIQFDKKQMRQLESLDQWEVMNLFSVKGENKKSGAANRASVVPQMMLDSLQGDLAKELDALFKDNKEWNIKMKGKRPQERTRARKDQMKVNAENTPLLWDMIQEANPITANSGWAFRQGRNDVRSGDIVQGVVDGVSHQSRLKGSRPHQATAVLNMLKTYGFSKGRAPKRGSADLAEQIIAPVRDPKLRQKLSGDGERDLDGDGLTPKERLSGFRSGATPGLDGRPGGTVFSRVLDSGMLQSRKNLLKAAYGAMDNQQVVDPKDPAKMIDSRVLANQVEEMKPTQINSAFKQLRERVLNLSDAYLKQERNVIRTLNAQSILMQSEAAYNAASHLKIVQEEKDMREYASKRKISGHLLSRTATAEAKKEEANEKADQKYRRDVDDARQKAKQDMLSNLGKTGKMSQSFSLLFGSEAQQLKEYRNEKTGKVITEAQWKAGKITGDDDKELDINKDEYREIASRQVMTYEKARTRLKALTAEDDKDAWGEEAINDFIGLLENNQNEEAIANLKSNQIAGLLKIVGQEGEGLNNAAAKFLITRNEKLAEEILGKQRVRDLTKENNEGEEEVNKTLATREDLMDNMVRKSKILSSQISSIQTNRALTDATAQLQFDADKGPGFRGAYTRQLEAFEKQRMTLSSTIQTNAENTHLAQRGIVEKFAKEKLKVGLSPDEIGYLAQTGMSQEWFNKVAPNPETGKISAQLQADFAEANESIKRMNDNLKVQTTQLERQQALREQMAKDMEAKMTGPGSAGRGFDDGLGALRDEMKYFRFNLTQAIPKEFSNALGGALHSAIRDGEKLGDTLRKAALGFLDVLNQKFMGHFADQITVSLFGPGKDAKAFNNGGQVPAMLTHGEFVMRKEATSKYGSKFMDELNKGKSPIKRQRGGPSLTSFFKRPIGDRAKGPNVASTFARPIGDMATVSGTEVKKMLSLVPGSKEAWAAHFGASISSRQGYNSEHVAQFFKELAENRKKKEKKKPSMPQLSSGSLGDFFPEAQAASRRAGLSSGSLGDFFPEYNKVISKPFYGGKPGGRGKLPTELQTKLKLLKSGSFYGGEPGGRGKLPAKLQAKLELLEGDNSGPARSNRLGRSTPFNVKNWGKHGIHHVRGFSEGGGAGMGLAMGLGSIAASQLFKEDEKPEHEALRDSWAENRYNPATGKITGNRPWGKKGRHMSARYMQQNQRVKNYTSALSQQKQAQLDERIEKFSEKQQLGRQIFSVVASAGLAKLGSHLQDTGAFGRADLAMGLGSSMQVQGPDGKPIDVKMSPDGRVMRSTKSSVDRLSPRLGSRGGINSDMWTETTGRPKWLGGSGEGKYATSSSEDFQKMLKSENFIRQDDGRFSKDTPEAGNRLERWGAKSYGDPGANMFGRTEGQSMLSWMNQQFNPFTWNRKNTGGKIKGQPGIDKIPAMLTEGEYVINADAARDLGEETLNDINLGRYASGGIVSDAPKSTSLGKGSENTNNITITINVDKSGSASEASAGDGNEGENDRMDKLSAKVKEQVVTIIKEESRPGGMLDNGE